MESPQQTQPSANEASNGLKLNELSVSSLHEIRKWAKFLAVLLFIGVGLMIIGGIAGLFAGSMADAASYPSSVLSATPLVMIVFLVIAAIYFIPANYLLKFSNYMKAALLERDEVKLAIALKNLNGHYKFIGILSIILIAFYLIMVLFMIIAGSASLYQRI